MVCPIHGASGGDFVDLCRGPHVQSMGLLKAVKLLSSSGHQLDPTPLTTALAPRSHSGGDGNGDGGSSIAMQRVHGTATW